MKMSGKNSLVRCGGAGGRSNCPFGLFLAEVLCCCSCNPVPQAGDLSGVAQFCPSLKTAPTPELRRSLCDPEVHGYLLNPVSRAVPELPRSGGCVSLATERIPQPAGCSLPASQTLTASSPAAAACEPSRQRASLTLSPGYSRSPVAGEPEEFSPAESAKRDASSQRLSYEVPGLKRFLEKHPLPSEDVTECHVLWGWGGTGRGRWWLLLVGAFSRFQVSQRQFPPGPMAGAVQDGSGWAVPRESGALAAQQVMVGGV